MPQRPRQTCHRPDYQTNAPPIAPVRESFSRVAFGAYPGRLEDHLPGSCRPCQASRSRNGNIPAFPKASVQRLPQGNRLRPHRSLAALRRRKMQLSRQSGPSRHPARRITRLKTHNRPRPETIPADDQLVGGARSRCGKLVNNLKNPARFLPVVLANLSKKRACRRFRPTQRDTDALPDTSKPFQYMILEKSHSSVYHGDGIGIPITCPAPPILPTFPADGGPLVQNVDNSEKSRRKWASGTLQGRSDASTSIWAPLRRGIAHIGWRDRRCRV